MILILKIVPLYSNLGDSNILQPPMLFLGVYLPFSGWSSWEPFSKMEILGKEVIS